MPLNWKEKNGKWIKTKKEKVVIFFKYFEKSFNVRWKWINEKKIRNINSTLISQTSKIYVYLLNK